MIIHSLLCVARTLDNLMCKSALVSPSALAFLESITLIASSWSCLLLTATSHAAIAGHLFGLSAFLTAAGLILELLFAIELLLSSAKNPVSVTVLIPLRIF